MIEVLCKDKRTGKYALKQIPVDDVFGISLYPKEGCVILHYFLPKRGLFGRKIGWVEVGESFDDVRAKLYSYKRPPMGSKESPFAEFETI